MKFVSIKYKKYKFPLRNHLKISNQIISSKDVIILKSEDELGNIHLGEVSPLAGFSKENIDLCESKIREFIANFKPIEITEFKKNISNIINCPSLSFGLEQLVLSCESDKLKKIDEYKVKVNGLVGLDSKEEVLKKIHNYVDDGFDTIKLKIGRLNFFDDLDIIRSISKEFGANIKLRLDNNGSWNISEAEINIDKLLPFNIEYLEQPVSNKEDLLKLSLKNQIPIAADEAVETLNDAIKCIDDGNIKYLILKPSIRVGIYDTISVIKKANKVGIKIIISSAFETLIGRNALLYLSTLVNHNLAHGLGTELIGPESTSTNIKYDSSIINFKYSDLVSTFFLDFK